MDVWIQKGANGTTCNGTVVEEADVIFLAVKPHILPEAIASIMDYNNRKDKPMKSKLFVSVLAGITISQLERVSILLLAFYYTECT